MVFLKRRPSFHGFHKLVIKSKNACKYINKTIFLEILYLKILNHALYFFLYANMICFIFERLDHMQIKIFMYFLIYITKTSLFNTKKIFHV